MRGCLVFFLVLLAQAASGQTPSSTFETANQAYRAGRHEEAGRLYESILSGGHESGALYLNLGNVRFRQGRLGEAIWRYEQARRILPGSAAIRHNLQITRQRLPEGVIYPVRSGIRDWLSVRNQWVLVMGIGLYAIGLFMIVISRRYRRVRLPGYVVFVFGLLLAGLVAASSSELNQDAVLTGKDVPLVEHTFGDAEVLRTLREGQTMTVLRDSANWIYVRLPGGETGWIPREASREI